MSATMKVLAAALFAVLAGCAPLLQHLPGGEMYRQAAEAEQLQQKGEFAGARTIWLRLAAAHQGSAAGSDAAYQAARVLVLPQNPEKDYRQAAREFGVIVHSQQAGAHAGDAAAWSAALESMEQAGVIALLDQVEALVKKAEEEADSRRAADAGREKAARERDQLARERTELQLRIDGLVIEKDGVQREKETLLKSLDALGREKESMEKKVESLTRDKERLLAAKARLEQRLRDVTEIDVNLEKKRRRIK